MLSHAQVPAAAAGQPAQARRGRVGGGHQAPGGGGCRQLCAGLVSL